MPNQVSACQTQGVQKHSQFDPHFKMADQKNKTHISAKIQIGKLEILSVDEIISRKTMEWIIFYALW